MGNDINGASRAESQIYDMQKIDDFLIVYEALPPLRHMTALLDSYHQSQPDPDHSDLLHLCHFPSFSRRTRSSISSSPLSVFETVETGDMHQLSSSRSDLVESAMQDDAFEAMTLA